MAIVTTAPVEFYRAVPRMDFDPARSFTRLPTARPPSNVPYLVDNIWELVRPKRMPSRRHAACASPSPELALENASDTEGGHDPANYVVCRVNLSGRVALAQLQVKDARKHDDLKSIRNAVMAVLKDALQQDEFEARSSLGPLFMPLMRPHDIKVVTADNPLAGRAVGAAVQASKFWDTVSTRIDPASAGEIFFELLDVEASYSLTPL